MKKKKKKSIIISMLLLTILVAFNGLMTVNGAVGSNNTPKPGKGKASGDPNVKAGFNNIAAGVRVSIVDHEGNKIGNAVDIWGSSGFAFNSSRTLPVYYYGSQRIKQEVSGSGGSPDTLSVASLKDFLSSGKVKVQRKGVNDGGHTAIIADYSCGATETCANQSTVVANRYIESVMSFIKANHICEGKIPGTCDSSKNWGGEKIWLDIFLTITGASSRGDYQTLLDNFMNDWRTNHPGENLPDKVEDYPYVKDSITDRFIQVEPVLFIEIFTTKSGLSHTTKLDSRYRYGLYGTVTELLYLEEAAGGSWFGNSNSNGFWKWLGVGVAISLDKPHPDIFQIEVTGNYDSELRNPKVGAGLGLIYFGDVLADAPHDCAWFVERIEAEYGVGTAAYEDAIYKLMTGSFSAMLTNPDTGEKQQYKSTAMYTTLNFLDKDYYDSSDPEVLAQKTKPKGYAECKEFIPGPPIITVVPDCGDFPATPTIDDCEEGETKFTDAGSASDLRGWLECRIAYTTKDGIHYSSDNTGHITTDADKESSYTMLTTGEVVDGEVVGNQKYCELFCYEKFETKFPTEVGGVKSGQTFFWGLNQDDGTYGFIEIYKKCSNQKYNKDKSEGYQYEKWEKDYKKNEQELVKQYLTYGANKASADKKDSYDVDYSWEDACCRPKPGGGSICSCKIYTTTVTGVQSSKDYNDPFINKSQSITSSKFSASQSSYSGYPPAEPLKNSVKSMYESVASSAEAEYNKYNSDQQGYLMFINQCTKNIKYVYDTKVYFMFKEPVNNDIGANSRDFEFDGELEVEPDPSEEIDPNNVDTSQCTDKEVFTYDGVYNGPNAPVTFNKTSKMVKDCKQVTWEIEGEWTYRYPAEQFTWFSLKYDSVTADNDYTLMNKETKDSEFSSISEDYFYSIGYGLPTALSLTSGKYGGKDSTNNKMVVIVNNLGDNGETNSRDYPYSGSKNYPDMETNYQESEHGHFENLIIGEGGTKNEKDGYGFEYACTYEVDNDFFGYDCYYNDTSLNGISPEYCDPDKDSTPESEVKGIDVAYRLVSLLDDSDGIDKAFPGKNGTGRVQGSNWNVTESELHDILDADVYDSLAMYEIMLDVATINYIRRDNQSFFSSGKDPYTSFYDASGNEKIICKSKGANGEYKYCASEFLTELQAGPRGYPLMGTCLPSGMSTEERAQNVLDNDCRDNPHPYTYTTWDWRRK